ncbi:hypothetical protein BVC80_9041g54 [Macleaya cordata]|uniref:Uncharacterized protein n=1 Tax=Macleaya cordata TaxID=56857 RepID=A0A200R2V1_MACCD|nr:hypothetical protein BVC80_9041g54 [Macleaya cordata]
MAVAINTLFAIVILSLVGKGFCQIKECSTADLKVSQTSTGKVIKGKPEYEVTVTNDCPCEQSNVTLTCEGFNTVEEVNPAIFNKQTCLVKNGKTFSGHESIKFKYAWDATTTLTVASSYVFCSS